MVYTAYLFDGQSSQSIPVDLTVECDGAILIRRATGESQRLTKGSYRFQVPVGATPIRIRFKNDELLLEARYDPKLVEELTVGANGAKALVRAESSVPLSLTIFLSAGIFSLILYLYGLPLLASVVKPLVPYSVKELAGDQILLVLDALMLEPSKLPTSESQRAVELSHAFDNDPKVYSAKTIIRSLKIRDTEIANAFAVLPNTVVLTDALLKKLNNDEVEGVIAHELGHLHYDHGTQMLLRSSFISVLSLALFGADPAAVQGFAVALIEARYSQEQESDADTYAVELLKRSKKDPKVLASALSKISEGTSESEIDRYLSSHPLTAERISKINALAAN